MEGSCYVNPASLWRDLGKPPKTSVHLAGVHAELGKEYSRTRSRDATNYYWPTSSLNSSYDVPSVICVFMLRLTVLCSSIHSVFASSSLCFVFCISRLCLFFLPLVPFFGHVTIFSKTCARDRSERRFVQNQNEYLLCWQPFSPVKRVKRILYCEALGLSNSGAAILVYDVILVMWTSAHTMTNIL